MAAMSRAARTSTRSSSAITMATTSSTSRASGPVLSRRLRVKVFERFHKLEIKTCPFSNLPQRDKGRWGQGLTADKMAECRWLKPQLVAQIEYADWTDVNHLRHSKFIALRDDKPAKDVKREQPVG